MINWIMFSGSLINYKLAMAAEHVAFEPRMELSVPAKLGVEDADLNVVIGNMLDNAIDAIVNCESNRFIKITMKLDRNVLFMEISNSYAGELCIRKGKLISSKTDGRDHGIGLQNVSRIAEKYSGKMELDHIDGVFTAKVMLYISEK